MKNYLYPIITMMPGYLMFGQTNLF